MKKRIVIALLAVVVVLTGATLAFGGPRGLIWDDGHYAKPGSLDDGKEFISQTKITTAQAVAAAQNAQSGAVGQVDLEHYDGKLVYSVDVGNTEVKVDAANGSIVGSEQRD